MKIENSAFWSRSGVPKEFINKLANLNTGQHFKIIWDLYKILIERSQPKINANYSCIYCGKTYSPDRYQDEFAAFCNYCHTPSCFRLRYSHTNFPRKQLNEMDYDYTLGRIINIGSKYGLNTLGFELICGFGEKGNYYAQFTLGERAYGFSPEATVIKAAILWPIAWDFNYNWVEAGLDSKQISWQNVLSTFYCTSPNPY